MVRVNVEQFSCFFSHAHTHTFLFIALLLNLTLSKVIFLNELTLTYLLGTFLKLTQFMIVLRKLLLLTVEIVKSHLCQVATLLTCLGRAVRHNCAR